VTRGKAGTELAFFDKKGEDKKPISPCVWLVEIVDRNDNSVLELESANRCTELHLVNINAPEGRLSRTPLLVQLQHGQIYRAEVTAQGAVGRSQPWIEP
jgi:hypothetical protein